MDYVIEKTEALKVIGWEGRFSYESSFQEIPEFWSQFFGNINSNQDWKAAMEENGIGEFGICIDDIEDGKTFRYLIAGSYRGGNVPEKMQVTEIPAAEWAKFKCTGPMPGALQSVNTRIFSEWLPGNPEYEIAFDMNIEWYSCGDTSAADYESEIWIPVKRK